MLGEGLSGRGDAPLIKSVDLRDRLRLPVVGVLFELLLKALWRERRERSLRMLGRFVGGEVDVESKVGVRLCVDAAEAEVGGVPEVDAEGRAGVEVEVGDLLAPF